MPPPRRSSLMGYTPSSRRGSTVKTQTVEFDETEGAGRGSTAPPLELMDVVPGYETITFEPACVPAPAENRLAPAERPVGGGGCGGDGGEAGGGGGGGRRRWSPAAVEAAAAPVTEREARAALLAHVSRRSCYGREAAKRHSVTALTSSAAFHYRLETFTERRECCWAFAPPGAGVGHGEEDVAGTGTLQPPPPPWDIPVAPRAVFEAEVKTLPVPRTASVKHCFRCAGVAAVPCHDCHAKGWMRCVHCNGDGMSADFDYKERCPYCRLSAHGFGRLDCPRCRATGRLACRPCDATGLLLYHVLLTVTWKTNTSEYIKKSVSLPDKCLRCVSGEEVVSQVGQTVQPLVDFPEEKINDASERSIQNHTTSFADQMILMQRQSVQAIAITEVQYKWNGRDGRYYVYGEEGKVHAPDYPQTCCCGCTLL